MIRQFQPQLAPELYGTRFAYCRAELKINFDGASGDCEANRRA